MPFRLQASIDRNQHKGLIALNSISGAPLVLTGLSLTNAQPLHVAMVDGSGSQITSFGSTQYAEGTTTTPGTGNLSLARYMAMPPSLADGAMEALQVDSSGNLKVTGSISVGGTTDNSAFVAGTSTGTPSMGFYHSTIDAVTDGRSAVIGITSKRAMLVNLQTAAGVETGVAGAPLQVSLANTGANATAVKVDGSAVTQPVSYAITGSGNATGALRVELANNGTGRLATVDAITAITNALPAGSNVIGHIISDTGSTTAVTQATAASLNATVVGTGTFATQATLQTGANLVGKVGIDQTTPGTTNAVSLAQIGSTTVATGNGVVGAGVQRVVIASDQTAFAVTTSPTSPTTIYTGKTSTVTAGTRVVLAASQTVKSVTVKALITNQGIIYVGDSTVASTNGMQLSAGESVSLDISNLNTVNIDSSINAEGVTYLGVN